MIERGPESGSEHVLPFRRLQERLDPIDPSIEGNDSDLAQLAIYVERILDEVDELKAVNAELRAELNGEEAAPAVPKPEAKPAAIVADDSGTERDAWRNRNKQTNSLIHRGSEPILVTDIIGATQRHGGATKSAPGDRFDIAKPKG